MDKIKIPPFEGYDKGPRWEASDEELADILFTTEPMELVVSPCDISGVCPYGAEFGTARCAYCGYTEEELNRYLDEDE